MLRHAGFICGYAGGILALICALLMLYTVPAGIVDSVVQQIGSELENEHIMAMGEMFSSGGWPSLSREAFEDFASRVAENSRLKHSVFNQAALFLYCNELNLVVSAALILISIVAAFVAFFGSLAFYKRPMAAGAMMLVSALVLLMSAIYTGTAIPTVLACLLLAAGGIIAFIPEKTPVPSHAGVRPYAPPDFPEDDDFAPTRMNREREAPADKIRVRVRRDDHID
ncbi:MAG: hypothetical protein ACOX8N_02920 [Christensenellales bacterium]|jgi:hypothetical protein